MHAEEQIFHLPGPRLVLLFFDIGQITQQMRPAHTVCTGIAVITRPAIMHGTASKARPDANRVQRLASTLGMPGQVRQPLCAVDMHPTSSAFHTYARFIAMLEWTGDQQISDTSHRRSQRAGCSLYPRGKCSLGERTAVEIR